MANVEKAKAMLKRALEERSAVTDMLEFEKENDLPYGSGYAFLTGGLVAYIKLALMELED